MNREEYLAELRSKLSGLPMDDLEERLAFYDEMIIEYMENGMTEEEAVAELGSVEKNVAQVMSEIPLSRIVQGQTEKPKRSVRAGVIILTILSFPVWFPLLVALFCVIFSLYLVLWVLAISLYLVDFSLVLGVLAAVISIAAYGMAGNLAGMEFMAGAGITCAGVVILLFQICGLYAKGILKLTGGFFLWVKSLFIGKEGRKNA